MHSDEIERILTDVSQGALSVEDALLALKKNSLQIWVMPKSIIIGHFAKMQQK